MLRRSFTLSSSFKRDQTSETSLHQLNRWILEYLTFHGFFETSATFEQEINNRLLNERPTSARIDNRSKVMPESQRTQIKDEMMSSLEAGDYKNYFYLWEKHVSPMLRSSDPETLKLEFFTRLYCATIPMREKKDKQEHRKYIQDFKQYLDMKAAILSTFSELLPYYAFPYIPDPPHIPRLSTCSRIKTYLESTFSRNIEQPYLHSLASSQSQPSVTSSSNNLLSSMNLNNGSGYKQVVEQQKKEFTAHMDFIQTKYRELFGLSTDLIRALEGVMSGKKLNKQFLNVIEDSLGSLQLESILPSMIPRNEENSNDNAIPFVSLDYAKLKHFFLKESNSAVIPYVLQALRWRLSKSSSLRMKINNMKTMIYYDIFGIVNNDKVGLILNFIFYLLMYDNLFYHFLILINIIASENIGLVYLTKDFPRNSLVSDLIQILEVEQSDTIIRQNVIAILQKVSVKSRPQLQMIESDVIETLCRILSDGAQMCSEYSTEYGVALLMNLCLGKGAIVRCEKTDSIIDVLMDLAQHESPQVRTYVNGTLYSLLNSSAVLKEKAISCGIEDRLRIIKQQSEDELAKQITFIQQVLERETVEGETEDENLDDEEEEDLNSLLLQDVESDEVIDTELEEESLLWSEDQPIGEELLCNFLASNEQAEEEQDLLKSKE
ncbi:hypothetical protein C9374_007594 [Naegleria lovaniensis]|uniref:LisH domain-containing protein ARMC9 n=1 Tax=Naegleria lovaniensis TaxID=51637 RepID=A0AA88KI75_NAELO|nr:uncharacterized protein C9374_007594 [Naegleria lovaniensis]KAG2378956.1 hypothetical protein C9374_007594 [Naegleria lovaniensis]